MATLLSINQIDSTTFQTENYTPSDESLLSINITSTVFNPETDYIETYNNCLQILEDKKKMNLIVLSEKWQSFKNKFPVLLARTNYF